MARDDSDSNRVGWPGWAKLGVSALLIFHGAAVLAAVLAAPPSSELQRRFADQFQGYYRLVDQGYSYRFYTGGAPPTPIIRAELEFEDGHTKTLRIPDPEARGPRLRFQRHLALAYHLFQDVRSAGPDRENPGRSASRWAATYARHLCGANPGCVRVVLRVQDHNTPDPRELVEAAREGRTLDVEDEDGPYYGPLRHIGAYSCND